MEGCETEGGGGGGGRGGGNLEPGGGRPQWSRCSGGGRCASGIVGGEGRLLGDIASVPGVPAASSSCCTNGRVSANLRNCCSTSGSSSGEQMLHRSSTGPFCESCAHQNPFPHFFAIVIVAAQNRTKPFSFLSFRKFRLVFLNSV